MMEGGCSEMLSGYLSWVSSLKHTDISDVYRSAKIQRILSLDHLISAPFINKTNLLGIGKSKRNWRQSTRRVPTTKIRLYKPTSRKHIFLVRLILATFVLGT